MRVYVCLSLPMFMALLLCSGSGCGGSKDKAPTSSSKATVGERTPSNDPAGAVFDAFEKAEGHSKALAGVPDRATEGKKSDSKGAVASAESAAPAAPMAKSDVADPIAGDVTRKPKAKKQEELPPGILTAGSFDDNSDPSFFHSFLRRQSGWMANHHGTLTGQRMLVIVRDSAGKPVMDARVKLQAGAQDGPEITTRADGRAVFLLSFDRLPENQPLVAHVTPPDGGKALLDNITPGVNRWEVTLPQVSAKLPRHLDLAILLDTTGSMGDEHRFVLAEIKGISAAIKRQYPEVEQRFALVCYRDQGDEYVKRTFDFDTLANFHSRLSAQSANGGGDFPEAVHVGMEELAQLRWKDRDTARVVLHIADAPPHGQHFDRTLKAVDQLRRKGVGIYPIACSGYDNNCEVAMRSTALLTGAHFLFLTDDSGVGGGHAEPKIPYYQVERLERLIARMIACELTGRLVDPAPSDIIRTVGKRPN